MARFKKNRKRRFNVTLVLSIIVAVLVFLASWIYQINIEKFLSNATNQYLTDVVDETTNKIHDKINENFLILDTICKFIVDQSDIKSAYVTEMLNKQKNGREDVSMAVITTDGIGVTDENHVLDANSRDYFIKSINGTKFVSSILTSLIDDEESIVFSVPIVKNEEIVGVLIAVYRMEAFSNFIGISSFQQRGRTLLMEKDGSLVTRPYEIGDHTNLFTMLEDEDNEKTVIKLKSDLQNGDSGIIPYKTGKYKRYICYANIADTDWRVVCIVSAIQIEPETDNILLWSTLLSSSITIIFVAFIVYLLMSNRKYHKL